MSKPIAKARSRNDIISMVKFIKVTLAEVFNFKGKRFPVCYFIECILPLVDEDFSYDYVEESEMQKGTYAYYDPINKLMKIQRKVYERACNGNPRDIFTLAHEIGHYFTVEGVEFARNENEYVPAYRDPEWQANVFAAELLMPSDEIIDMTPSEIVTVYGVSYQAACIALKNAKKAKLSVR